MLRNPPKVIQLVSDEVGRHQPRSVCSLTPKPCNDTRALNTVPHSHKHKTVVNKTILTVPPQFTNVVNTKLHMGFFHWKRLKATTGLQWRHRTTKIKELFPRIIWPSIYLFLMTRFCTHLYCKEKPTRWKVNYLCSTSRWTKRLRGLCTLTHTNGKHRFVLTTYDTTKIFMNVSCSKVHLSSKSTYTQPKTA